MRTEEQKMCERVNGKDKDAKDKVRKTEKNCI
jgi:hypothetical protein